jgi:adenylate kinase
VPVLSGPLFVQGEYQLTAQSHVRNDSILLLHFILSSISPAGNPAVLMSEMLRAFLPGDIFQYQEIQFDMSDERSLISHDATLRKLMHEIQRYIEDGFIF